MGIKFSLYYHLSDLIKDGKCVRVDKHDQWDSRAKWMILHPQTVTPYTGYENECGSSNPQLYYDIYLFWDEQVGVMPF